MSCNCKKVRKVESLFPTDNSYEKRGCLFFIMLLLDGLASIANKLIALLVFIVAVPLLLLNLTFNLLFRNQMAITLPAKWIKQIKKHEENNG